MYVLYNYLLINENIERMRERKSERDGYYIVNILYFYVQTVYIT